MAADVSVRAARPRHLLVVGVLALLWNSVGAFDYLATQMQLESYVGQFTEEQRAYFAAFPAWMVSAWAFGVWGAFAGSIGLLMGRAWAVYAFALSVAGLAVTSIYNFALTNGVAVMGPAALWMSVVVWAIALALLWYALQQRRNGVLR